MGAVARVFLLGMVLCTGGASAQEFDHLETLETRYLVALLSPDVYADPKTVRVGKLPEPLSWFVPMPHRLLVHATYDQFFGAAAVVTLLDGRAQLRLLVERAVDLGWDEVPRNYLEQAGQDYEACVCGMGQQVCARVLSERDQEMDIRIQVDPFPLVCRKWSDDQGPRPELLNNLEKGLGACNFLRFRGGAHWSQNRVSFVAELGLESVEQAFRCVEREVRTHGLGFMGRPASKEYAESSVHRAALIDWDDGAGNLWTGVLRADAFSKGSEFVTVQFGLHRP